MTGLPCLTLWQPWASLIVPLLVKWIETRGWAAPASLIGMRIGIHAAARPINLDEIDGIRAAIDVPKFMGVPERWWEDRTVICPNGHVSSTTLGTEDGARCLACRKPVAFIAPEWGAAGDLPFGVLLGTARLTDCVPMVDHDDWGGGDALILRPPLDRDGMGVANPPEVVEPWRVVSDQRPYGDFRPGRWAWLLNEITPTTEQCPHCRGRGEFDKGNFGEAHEWEPCPTCRGEGFCDPIPAKGAQRVWYWQPESEER